MIDCADWRFDGGFDVPLRWTRTLLVGVVQYFLVGSQALAIAMFPHVPQCRRPMYTVSRISIDIGPVAAGEVVAVSIPAPSRSSTYGVQEPADRVGLSKPLKDHVSSEVAEAQMCDAPAERLPKIS